ncbi:hypothetical protein JHK85_000528 [Glycine max]|nr:hypothetical protein JHK85_000528 [Glycine max]KAG5087906.1 hypothetical protein JHK86_000518 [Glycine max]
MGSATRWSTRVMYNAELLTKSNIWLSASFFITYVVTQGWTSVSSELFRVIPFIFSWITRPFTSQDDEFEVPSTPYHKDIPRPKRMLIA